MKFEDKSYTEKLEQENYWLKKRIAMQELNINYLIEQLRIYHEKLENIENEEGIVW